MRIFLVCLALLCVTPAAVLGIGPIPASAVELQDTVDEFAAFKITQAKQAYRTGVAFVHDPRRPSDDPTSLNNARFAGLAYLHLAISLLEDVRRAGIPLTPEAEAYYQAALRNAMVYQYGLMNYDATIELGNRYSEINPEAEGEYAFHVLMGNAYAFLNTISVVHGQLAPERLAAFRERACRHQTRAVVLKYGEGTSEYQSAINQLREPGGACSASEATNGESSSRLWPSGVVIIATSTL